MLTNEYYTKEIGHMEMEFDDNESENICDDPIIERAVFERKCLSNLCNYFYSILWQSIVLKDFLTSLYSVEEGGTKQASDKRIRIISSKQSFEASLHHESSWHGLSGLSYRAHGRAWTHNA